MPREEVMYKYQILVFVKQYNLGSYVLILGALYIYTLYHYCEMVATAAGNKISKHLEAA